MTETPITRENEYRRAPVTRTHYPRVGMLDSDIEEEIDE